VGRYHHVQTERKQGVQAVAAITIIAIIVIIAITAAYMIWWACQPTEYEQDEVDRLGIENAPTPWIERAWLAVGMTLCFTWVLICMSLEALFPSKAGAK